MTPGIAGGARHDAAARAATTILSLFFGAVGSVVVDLQLHENRLLDAFHYGEYFAYFLSLRSGAFDGGAISLHGAMEYAPAWIARLFAGPDHYIFWALVIQAGLSVVSVFCFGLVAWSSFARSPRRYPLLPLAMLIAPLLLTAREPFLLLSIWLFMRRLDPEHRDRRAVVCEVALGVTMVVGLFWSFDRGLAQSIAIGLPALLIAARRPLFRIAALSWIVTLLAIGFGTRAFAISGYVHNLLAIVDVSAQFSYGWIASAVVIKAAGLAITLIAMTTSLLVARVNRDAADASVALMLALLCAVLLRSITYRADFEHLAPMFWAPLLALSYAADRLRGTAFHRAGVASLYATATIVAALALRFGSADRALFGLLLLSLLVLAVSQQRFASRLGTRRAVHAAVAIAAIFLLTKLASGIGQDGFAWIARITAVPTNDESVAPELLEIAATLRAARVPCVLDLSNRGALNALLDRRSCTRFTYPVYATPKDQDEMIATLAVTDVDAILYSSKTWSYRVDGETAAVRLPKLDAYLRARFPVERCTATDCFRFTR